VKRTLLTLSMLLVAASVARAQMNVSHDPDPLATPLYVQATTDSISYATKIASGNLCGITITNYGFIGNNFISRDPSFEYPLGSGMEHVVRAGVWIGAQAIDDNGPFTGVVTGTVDGSQGQATQSATEFTPAGRAIAVRSSLANSEFFSKKAVSELDMMSDYSDRPAKRSDNNGEGHRPMGILVHQENYAWSFSEFAHSNFFHFQLINNGPPMQNIWIGIYAEFASGCKVCSSSWPPTGWFNKKWIAVDDTLTMKSGTTVKTIPALFREHYCLALPTPNGCNLNVAPYWAGIKALGWKKSRADTVNNKKVTFSAWRYAPGSSLRNEDLERYGLMSTGLIQPTTGDSLAPSSGDPVELIAIGPFSELDPGDTLSADFAFVGGAEISDIQNHARFAQRAFDRDYIVPIPPPSPRLKAIARHNAVDLWWDNSPESAIDVTSPLPQDFEGYRVYIGEDRLDLHRIAQFDLKNAPHDTTGFNTGFAAIARDTVIDGQQYHYHYSIDHLRDGFKYFVGVTSYDIGNVEIEPLESGITQNKTETIPAPAPGEKVGTDKVIVFPNPYRVEARWDHGLKVRDHYLWFTNLPSRATIKIFTLSGDLVYTAEFDGATYHGASARGLYNPSTDLDVDPPTLSKRTFAWDMITSGGQAAATGLYMFAVEDKATGDKQRGKFLIVKSDREDF
jgi:hypothetical protein